MRRSMLLLFVLGSMAYAQLGEVAVSVGTSRLRNNSLGNSLGPDLGTPATEVIYDTNFRMGLRLTFNSYKFFGHEIGYAYNRGKLKIPADTGSVELGMPIHQGMYNFLAYATPEGSPIRPFGTGGVHFSSFYPPGSSVFQGNGVTKFGINFGGGIKVRVSDSWLIRVDLRDYWTAKPDFGFAPEGWLRQLEVSAGFGFAF